MNTGTRSTLALVTSLLVLPLAACTSATEDPAPEPTAVVDPDAASCPAGLAEGIGAWGQAGFTGVLTVLRGTEACTVTTGLRDPDAGDPMTPDTVFAIGSVSKAVTATAVLELAADGELDLDDAAGSLLPGLDGPAASATVDQLLAHTSGLQGGAGPDHEPLSRDAAIEAISALPQEFPAGTDYGYTNGGYTLLALIIDEITGDYRSYVADHLLPEGAGFWDGEPAAVGPRAVGYTEDGRSEVMGQFTGPHWATAGNGDIAMTVPQLAGWAAALFHGELVSASATAAAQEPRWDLGEGASETYGWVRFGEEMLGATGFGAAGGGGDTGHSAVVVHVPDSDTTIAVASSTPGVTAEQLLQSIVVELLAGEPIPRPEGADATDATAPDDATVERVAGTYELEDGEGTLVVAPVEGGVSVSAVGDGAVDALFGPPAGFTTDDVEAHEQGVVELLTGGDEAGDEERRLLAETLGRIVDVRLLGTVTEQGELRTHVTLVGSERTLDGWYALDEHGGVAAAQVPADPPALTFEQQREETLISTDPTGRRADVHVTLDGDALTVDNGTGVTTARRAD